MVIMFGMNRLWRIFLLVSVVGMAAWGSAQDAPETPAATPPAEAPAVSAAPDDAGLTAEVEQLRAEIDRLKRQVAYLNSVVEQLQEDRAPVEKSSAKRPPMSKKKTAAAAPAPPVAPVVVPELDDRTPVTVLVFHDGHRTEARNYAIVGQTLWIYTEQDSRKVPLADLDVAATKNANSDRGIIFQVPPTK